MKKVSNVALAVEAKTVELSGIRLLTTADQTMVASPCRTVNMENPGVEHSYSRQLLEQSTWSDKSHKNGSKKKEIILSVPLH
jgi:hypothetical protein